MDMSEIRWRIKDIIDFEYFLKQDEKEAEDSVSTSIRKWDRAIYLEHIQPEESRSGELALGRTLRIWLEKRRELEKTKADFKGVLPGETFDEIYRILQWVLMIIAFFSGAGLAVSFLHYQGTEPLNIAVYLGCFVLTQVFLLLVLIFMYLLRSWKRRPLRSSPIFILLSGLMGRLMTRVKRGSLKALSGSRRDMLEGTIGLIQGKKQAYGNLFYWPVFFLSQSFMVAWNIGVLSATLLKVFGADIAFGWQSTIQFGDRFVFDLVKIIASPWSWFVPPGTAYPTLAQIEGSRMVLKEGIYHLSTADLVSWWPFLCLSLIFYGLFPRVIVLILGHFLERRALGRVNFDHNASARLYNRMITPIVQTKGDPVERGAHVKEEISPTEGLMARSGTQPGRDVIALIPEEIYGACPMAELRSLVFGKRGSQILSRMKIDEDDEIEREFFQREEYPDIMLLQESWQPPIRESLLFLRDLRKAIGKSPKIIVGLIGRPRENHFFTRIKANDFKAWDNRIKTLRDPRLELERLELNAG